MTAALVPAAQRVRGRVITREPAVLCGRAWAQETFRRLDPAVHLNWNADDGERLSADQVIFEISGPARPVLTGERTALNFLQLLSGTATAARAYVDAIAGTACRILDTRKTLPGLRSAQKYAVRCGGADNHRLGLFDQVLIKENHIAAAGSISAAIAAARTHSPGCASRSKSRRRRSSRKPWPRVRTSSCWMSSRSRTCAPRWRCAMRAARR